MGTTPLQVKDKDTVVIEAPHLEQLLQALTALGYEVIGPTIRDRAVIVDRLNSAQDLPIGWTDEQEPGTYRLKRREDRAYFGYSLGPQSWKRILQPPVQKLWSAERSAKGFSIVPEQSSSSPSLALIGVRPCELRAIEVQDKIFLSGDLVDSNYKSRRGAFVVVVNCSQAGGTCFCASMGSGPSATSGFDLALTEIVNAEKHYFVVDVGSDRGAKLLLQVAHSQATAAEKEAAHQVVAETARHMGRTLNTAGLKDLLYSSYDHPRWDNVAARCLSCTNCTMVCPTCFCTTIKDATDLAGRTAERWKEWDSCFTTEFSYIHGGSVRASVKSRYRQWLIHKLATWSDQFDVLGCVGCGRCITWCPVGIDLTEEVRAIRGTDSNPEGRRHDSNA